MSIKDELDEIEMELGGKVQEKCTAGHRERGGNVENPCEKCNRKGACRRPELEGADYTLVECGTVCEDYARYLGHQEGYAVGESDRDALRAEVETLRRALEWMVHPSWCDNCPLPEAWRLQCGAGNCREVLAEWSISEARKGA